MSQPKNMGPVFIVVAAVLWALDGITRRSLYHLPPVTIVFLEHLIGLLILAPFTAKLLKSVKFTPKVIVLTLAIGLLGGLLGTLFITTALARVGFIAFSVVFLIQKLQPIFAITSAHFLLGEKVTTPYLKWAGLALVAAFFVTFPNGQVNLATGSGTLVAALYSLGAAIAWGIGTTLSRMLVVETTDTAATWLRYASATAFGVIAMSGFGVWPSLSQVGLSEIGRLVFIALTTGLVAMVLYYRGLKTTEAKISTILELTFPLLAVFVDMFLYKTYLTLTQYAAAGMLLLAMMGMSRLKSTPVEITPQSPLAATAE